MATYFTHSRIANAFLRKNPTLDACTYICGSHAPDTGRKLDEFNRYEPTKEVSHFEERIDGVLVRKDLVFYNQYLRGKRLGVKKRSFLLGYYHHLVVDNLWARNMNDRVRLTHRDLYIADRQQFWFWLKNLWALVETPMHRQSLPELPETSCLAQEPDYLPFVPNSVIESGVLRHHRQTFEMQPRPGKVDSTVYSAGQADHFVEVATEYLGIATSRADELGPDDAGAPTITMLLDPELGLTKPRLALRPDSGALK